MADRLADNLGNIFVLAVVAVLMLLAIRSMVRDRRAGKSSCGGNCGACGVCHGGENATAEAPAAAGCSACPMAGKCPGHDLKQDS